jgi:hypothetical protein
MINESIMTGSKPCQKPRNRPVPIGRNGKGDEEEAKHDLLVG